MNLWLVIGITALVFLLCAVIEIRRRNKRQLVWRLLASGLLCACLACLIIRPVYRAKNSDKRSTVITVLLTPGFNRDSLSALGDSLHLFSADDELITENSTLKIRPLISADNLSAENNLVHVFGHGLKKADSGFLKGRQIRFHPTLPAGITKAAWPSVIRTGEYLTLGGTYRNEGDKPVKLLLEGMGRNLDSVVIAPKQTQNFTLQNKP
ncbi:MAG: hypothetical protein INR69_23135, partial [Mucilaginibacter polytrichastri]|nr:hypothetical protein [Mucilaginibacter polytrichastri]